MAQSQEKMSNLVAYTVSADHERPDLEACLEISDRVNGTKPECVEAINSIIKCLLGSNYKTVLNTVQLLETLCKNCNMRFLYELNNKKLIEAIMKILEKRRQRSKSKSTSSKPVDKVKLQVEEKLLYLMQLWADTFMMHQEEFANVHAAYRTLRKEGIKFPDRDPNEKFMMNFQGQVSPIFLAMDEDYIVPSNNQGGPVPDPRKKNEPPKPTKEPEYRHEVHASSRAVNTLYNEEDEYDYSVYDGVEVSRDEVKVLEESINILKEIEANATVPGDMKSEIANEILADLVHVHKRIKRLVHSDKFASTSQRNEALRLNDMINSCLASYKARYNVLKNNYAKGIKSEPLAPPPGVSNEEKGSPDGESGKRKASAEGQKPAFVGARKLAPPKGWKGPKEENPDLIDLMSGGDEPVKQATPGPNEEKKEETQAKQEKPSRNLMDEFLEMNFNQPAPVQNNNNFNNFGFNFGQMPQQQSMLVGNPMFTGNMYQQPGFNQPNPYGTAPMFAQGGQNPATMNGGFANSFDMFATQQIPVRTSLGVNTNTGGASPLQIHSPITPQVQPQSHPQGSLSSGNSPMVQQQSAGVANDDDDFFSDIANRKK